MATSSWIEAQDAFGEAAAWLVQIAPAGRNRWHEPALGEWTVRDLTGHASRALLTVESYLDKPATAAQVPSAVDYFRRMLDAAGDPAAVAKRGRDAGAALGDDPAAMVATIVQRVLPRIRASAPEDLVTTPAGGMRLADYLPTRTFELTIHTCDLAAALGQTMKAPEAAVRESFTVLGGLASRSGRAATVLLAATGRGPLPDGFTLL